MKYDDWKDANERIADQRKRVYAMSTEELAALDMAQQIESYEFQIKYAQEQLKRLKAATKKLDLWPDPELVKEIHSEIVKEAKFKFRGKRDLEAKLYGFPPPSDY